MKKITFNVKLGCRICFVIKQINKFLINKTFNCEHNKVPISNIKKSINTGSSSLSLEIENQVPGVFRFAFESQVHRIEFHYSLAPFFSNLNSIFYFPSGLCLHPTPPLPPVVQLNVHAFLRFQYMQRNQCDTKHYFVRSKLKKKIKICYLIMQKL